MRFEPHCRFRSIALHLPAGVDPQAPKKRGARSSDHQVLQFRDPLTRSRMMRWRSDTSRAPADDRSRVRKVFSVSASRRRSLCPTDRAMAPLTGA
jgi:hypothetical protein